MAWQDFKSTPTPSPTTTPAKTATPAVTTGGWASFKAATAPTPTPTPTVTATKTTTVTKQPVKSPFDLGQPYSQAVQEEYKSGKYKAAAEAETKALSEIKPVKAPDLKQVVTSLKFGTKALPSMAKTATGILLQNWVDYTKSRLNRTPFWTPKEEKERIKQAAEKVTAPETARATAMKQKGYEESRKISAEFAQAVPQTGTYQDFVNNLAFNAPQVLANTGLGVVIAAVTKNPVLATSVGISTSYALNAGDAYNEAKDFGLSEDKAQGAATFAGLITAPIDIIPFESLFGKAASKPIKQSLIKNLVEGTVFSIKQAGLEGFSEGIQKLESNAIAKTYNENKDLLEGVTQEAFAGMIFGALIGGGTDVLSNVLPAGKQTTEMETPEGMKVSIDEKGKIVEVKSPEGTPIKTTPVETPPLVTEATKVQEEPTPEVNPLLVEARKYKSAEESVSSQLEKIGLEEKKDLDKLLLSRYPEPTEDSIRMAAERVINKDLPVEVTKKLGSGNNVVGDVVMNGKHYYIDVKQTGGEVIVNTVNGRKVNKTFSVEELYKQEPLVEVKTLKPSEAVGSEEIVTEATKIQKDQIPAYLKETKEGYEYARPTIGKTEMKTLLTDKSFRENPVFTVNKDKSLTFKSPTSEITVTAKALQLNPENLTVGDQIKVDIEAIKKGKAQQLRVYGKGGAEATTGMESIGEFEKRVPKTEAGNFKLFKEVENLIKKYAQTVGEGYLPKGAAGVYFGKTGNIRVNGMNDLFVASHEITHFLDTAYNITESIREERAGNKDVRANLTQIYLDNYPGARATHPLRTRVREGLAVLLSKYAAFPQLTTLEYPELVNDFINENGKFHTPIISEVVNDLSSIVEKYQGLSALDKIGARVTSDNVEYDRKKFMKIGDYLRTQIADEVFPLEKLDILTGRAETPKSVSLHARQNQQINGVVANNIVGDKGYWRYTGSDQGFQKTLDYNWGDLVKTLEKEKTSESFGNYLVARATYYDYLELGRLQKTVNDLKDDIEDKLANGWTKEEITTLKEEGTGMTPAEALDQAVKAEKEQQAKLDNDGITQAEAKQAYFENREIFGNDEKMFDALVNQDLQLMHEKEVGLLSDKNYKRYMNEPGYATRKRQFYDQIVGELEPVSTGKVRLGGTSISTMIRRKGSKRTIINPVYQSIMNHSEIVKKTYRQLVRNKLNSMAGDLPLLAQKVDLIRAYDPKTGKTYYPQAKDPNIVISMKNGKRTAVLWDNYVKTTFDNLITPENFDGFQRLMINMSGKFTRGTTGLFPAFTLTNLTGDQIALSFNTKNKSLPLQPILSGRALLKAKNPEWKTENKVVKIVAKPMNKLVKALAGSETESSKYILEYLVLVGDRQTFMGNQELSPAEVLQKIGGEVKGIKKVTAFINKGIDVVALPSKYSEIITRASEYAKARKAGKPQIVALEEAGRVTAPFHHVGKWWGKGGKALIKAIPFMNPSIQALEQSVRTIENPQTRMRALTVLSMITAAAVGSLALLMSGGTDDQKRLYNDLTAEELVNYIWFPLPDGKTLGKIKTQQYGILGGMMNMMIGNMLFNSQYKGRDFISAAGQILPSQFDITQGIGMILNWLPSWLKTQVEVAFNVKSYPKIMPIENEYLLSYPVEQRFNSGTSEGAKLLSKYLGKYFNLSPVKIDYLLTGNLGRATGLITGKKSAFDLTSGLTRKEYWTSGRTVQGYYDMKAKNDATYKALKNGTMTLPTKEEDKVIRIHQRTLVIDKLFTKFQKIDINADPQSAAEYRNEIIRQINLINEDGSGNKRSMNPLAPSQVMAAEGTPRGLTPEKAKEWEKLDNEADLYETNLRLRLKQNKSAKGEEGAMEVIRNIRLKQGEIVRTGTVEQKKIKYDPTVAPDTKEQPIMETFDVAEVPREVAFGIMQGEGGKINRFNLGAVDADPTRAVKFKDNLSEATAAARFLSGEATPSFYGNREKGKEAFAKAFELRDDPEAMLKAIEAAGYAGNPKTWKKRSVQQDPKHGAGLYYDSWSEFIMDTPAWKKWADARKK